MIKLFRKSQEKIPVKRKTVWFVAALTILFICQYASGQDEPEDVRIQEYDHVYVKNATQPLIGTIVRKTDTHVYIRLRDYNTDIDTPIRKDLIEKIEARTTPLQAFHAKRSKVGIGDFKACYEVAKWSMQFNELRERTKEALRDCVKINPVFIDSYIFMSDLLKEEQRVAVEVSEEDLNEEIELYHHAIRSGLNDSRIFYRLGIVVREAGLPEAAISAFKQAINGAADTQLKALESWSRLEIGEILIGMEKPEEALEQFEEVLAENPNDFRALLGKGEAKLMIGELDDAGEVLTSAIPSDTLYPKPYILLGSVAYFKGELSDAETWLNKAKEVSLPDALILTSLGLVHARMGRFISAGRELSEALLLDGNCWQAEVARGYLAENMGNTEDAISAYQSALSKKPGYGLPHFKLASAYESEKNYDTAAIELGLALEYGYRPVEVFKYLGRIEYERREFDVASRYFRYAVASNDSDADAHYLLAMCCLKLNMDSLARRHFQRAVDINSVHTDAFNGLGYLAYRSGDFDRATAFFSSALSASPNDAYAKDGIARIGWVLNWDLWEDSFGREDSDDISNGWQEEERFGVEIRIENKRAKFNGTQREGNKKTAIYKTESGKKFARFEAFLDGSGASGAKFGIMIEKRNSKDEVQGAIVFVKDYDGSLSYNYMEERGKWKSEDIPLVIEPYPLDMKSHAFGIGVLDSATGTYELFFDNNRSVQVTCSPLARISDFTISIFGESAEGEPWSLAVDKVLIYRER